LFGIGDILIKNYCVEGRFVRNTTEAQIMKRVLVLNGSETEVPVIQLAKKRGDYVIVTGGDSTKPGNALADEYIQADFSNYELIYEIAKEKEIDAVIACSNDFGAITASYVADKLNLPGHDTFENALNLHQKDRFKKIAKEIALLSVESVSFDNLELAEQYVKDATYPLIIKPVDLTGGKGISRADTVEEALDSIHKAFERSRAKRVIIEPFIVSKQHAIFTFIYEGKVQVAYVVEDHYLYNKYLASHNSGPARNEEPAKSIVIGEMNRLCKELQLRDGFFELQYMTSDDGQVYIVETMRRLPGNIALSAVDRVSDISWTQWYLLSQCGEDCSRFIQSHYQLGCSSMISIMGEKNGRVEKVFISDELKQYVFHEQRIHPDGHEIEDYLVERMAYLLCTFPSEDVMYRIIDNIQDHARVIYADETH